MLTGKASGHMGHTLLIAALVHPERTGILIQRLSQSDHDSVAKDGKHTVNKFCLDTVQLNVLIVQEFYNGLAHSHDAHWFSSLSQHTVSPYFSLLALIKAWICSA